MKATCKQLLSALVAACMAIALTACGGGSDSGNTGSTGDTGNNNNNNSDGGSTQVEKPTIGTQPASQSVVTGSAATFAVSATGSEGGGALVYQWKKNGTDIPGATASTYTTPATSNADIAAELVFSVAVSNSAGTAVSNGARLTVTAEAVKPGITKQPESLSVIPGASASFFVNASGSSPFGYQWKKNGADIPGATASSYTLAATSSADHDAVFTVVVTNAAGTVTSSEARLAVSANVVAPGISSQPENQSVTAGQRASFSVSATGTSPFGYQWKKNGTEIPGATSSSYTLSATSSADHDAVFVVVVSNSEGHVTSSEARLTVTPVAVAPTITSQPTAQFVAPGKTATFTVAASGTGELHYQWQKFGANIAGANTPSYTTSAVSDMDTGDEYSVVVSNSVGRVISSAAVLTVSKYSRVLNASGGRYELTECVKDNGTGLIWEGKTASGDRAGSNTYTNFDSTTSLQNLVVAIALLRKPDQSEIDASTNSIGYRDSVRAIGLCGFTDWRLPTKEELVAIRDTSKAVTDTQIDSTWFPNTQALGYWSSDAYPSYSYGAWNVSFAHENVTSV